VEQEVGGSSPPNCTTASGICSAAPSSPRLPIQIERVKQRDGHRPAQRVFARKTGRSGIPAAVVLASDASGTLDARLKPSIIPMGDRQLPGEPTVPLMAAFIRTMF
jgi:hypothetical protein